jgi:5-methylcytosine-specific restriction enzyme subunit McrC
MNNKTIQIFEHQTLKIDAENKFKSHHFDALKNYGYKTNEKYFSVGHKRIKFSNYVGVIQVKNLTIEILPKADSSDDNEKTKSKWHDALISMLQECKLIKLNSISNAKLKTKSASILDLYYDAFLTEAEKIVRHGMIKSYRTVSENLNKIKGKIDFSKHILKNYLHKERFFVEHKIYDTNNKFNQILLKALVILEGLSNNPKYLVRIKKLLLDFENIQEKNITSSWFDNLQYNRNTERYRYAISLAKLIILKYLPNLKGGKEDVLAIMFDMNMLYENYIYRKLKVLQHDSEIPIIRVREQNRKPFWETRGIRADIVIETESDQFVIDTKWKILKSHMPSDADLKQMFVYNLHYDSDLSILLYPKTTFETNLKKPYRNDGYKHKNCQIAFSDLFDTEGNLVRDLGYRLYNELLKHEIVNSKN